MQNILLVAGVSVAYGLFCYVANLRHSIAEAKRSGFNYVVVPCDPFALPWQLTHRLWMRVITLLPESWWEEWLTSWSPICPSAPALSASSGTATSSLSSRPRRGCSTWPTSRPSATWPCGASSSPSGPTTTASCASLARTCSRPRASCDAPTARSRRPRSTSATPPSSSARPSCRRRACCAPGPRAAAGSRCGRWTTTRCGWPSTSSATSASACACCGLARRSRRARTPGWSSTRRSTPRRATR